MSTERLVLSRLMAGPRWRSSFKSMLPVLNDLLAAGKVELCAAEGRTERTQVRLTEIGRRAAQAMGSESTLLGAHLGSGDTAFLQADALSRLMRENARRRPCPRCTLSILPETQARHDAIHHDEELAA